MSPYVDLDESSLAPRRRPNGYDDDLLRLQQDEDANGKWKELDRFSTVTDKGKASSAKMALVNRWGRTPSVTGFEFRAARTTNGLHEVLAVKYDRELIEEGAWDRFNEERIVKARETREAKEKKAKEEEEAAKVEAEKNAARLRRVKRAAQEKAQDKESVSERSSEQ